MKYIKIKGARTHNLKNIDLNIPRDQLVVITGLSGSGKSSLAFDTIYAEGQRRYVESLSSYAQQFIGLIDKPDVDLIEGLSPAIAINQRSIGNNPRSTVGTITEIYDYLRLLYARIGEIYCPYCGQKLKRKNEEIKTLKLIRGRKTEVKRRKIYYVCEACSYTHSNLEPKDFSFNSSQGACLSCGGIGFKSEIDPELVFNKNLSILEGAIKPLSYSNLLNSGLLSELKSFAERKGINLNLVIKEMGEEEKDLLLKGDTKFSGLINILENKYQTATSSFVKQEIQKCMKTVLCPSCQGARLKKDSLVVKIEGLNIYELSQKSVRDLKKIFSSWSKKFATNFKKNTLAQPILKEIILNLNFLSKVGLEYLSLDRSSASLSGGEFQRIKLASQVGSSLSGVLYVLDEPSIGLHQRDNDKLITMLKELKDNDNSVIVVEHDASMMLAADHLIDIGPGAGETGGEVIFSGKPERIKNKKESLTGQYLSGKKEVTLINRQRKDNNKFIEIIGANEHNLKNIDVKIPLGKLVAITGVSGSGKSTLMNDILAKYLLQQFYRAKDKPGEYKEIKGVENINKIINIDQSPIGKTPRSNPATYTGIFTYIRDLFASLPESKLHNLSAGHFSFNVPGGRCNNCAGDGVIKVDMQFLSDVYITCDVCQGKRFKQKILDVKYKGKNIYEVLEMTVSEAKIFFSDHSALQQKLSVLEEVGLGYIKLGQSATTFSGGEAQRIKLATELSRRATGKTLYILDEPTTGLHFDDINRLLKVLNMLVNQGNTVLIIEHNLDVIKLVDWVIDLGPDGGDRGGKIIAEGPPQKIIKVKRSYTGRYLKEIMKK